MTRTLHNALVALILIGIGALGVGAFCVARITAIVHTEAVDVSEAIANLDNAVSDLDLAVNGTADHLNGAIDGFGKDSHGVLTEARKTLVAVNRSCGTPKHPQPCGTLADVAKTLATVRGAAGQVEVAAGHENKRLGTLDDQETKLYTDADAAIAGLAPVEKNAAQSFTDLDAILKSPDVKGTLQSFNGISGDLYTKLHPLLNPPPCTTKGCKVKRVFQTIWAFHDAPEAAYWTEQLLQAAGAVKK
jgi:hypothetical protein